MKLKLIGGEPYEKEDLNSVLSWPSSVTIVAYEDDQQFGMLLSLEELGNNLEIILKECEENK